MAQQNSPELASAAQKPACAPLLRLAQDSDAQELLAIYAPYVLNTAISFEEKLPSLEAFAERIQRTLAHFPWLVLEDHGIVGYAYASRLKQRSAYNWSVETSIYLRQDQRRKGLGRLLYTKLEELLADQGICNCYACLTWSEQESELLTHASLFFHQSLGYQTCGHFHQCGYKFGRWWDILWLEKHLRTHAFSCSHISDNPEEA